MSKSVFVNVSCANVYKDPSFRSELETQVLLWDQLRVDEDHEDFIKIRTEDDYVGWVNRFQIVETKLPSLKRLKVSAALANIYSEPSIASKSMREVTVLARVPVLNETGEWVEVLLPDGEQGWMQKKAFEALPELTRQNLVTFAKKFLGVTYFWGGKTPKGFDCSGLTQCVFQMFGIPLKRNASMQFENGKHVSNNPEDGEAGDLMFFEEDGKISHVGICLGDGEILHARGFVRINSLVPGKPDFDGKLRSEFVAIKTYF